jgi:hypothetical protein
MIEPIDRFRDEGAKVRLPPSLIVTVSRAAGRELVLFEDCVVLSAGSRVVLFGYLVSMNLDGRVMFHGRLNPLVMGTVGFVVSCAQVCIRTSISNRGTLLSAHAVNASAATTRTVQENMCAILITSDRGAQYCFSLLLLRIERGRPKN